MKILVIPYSYPNKYNENSAPFCLDQTLALKAVGNDVCVLAVVLVSFKTILKKRLFSFKQRHKKDGNNDLWLIHIPAIPKFRFINNLIRTIVGYYVYKKHIKRKFVPDVIHVHGFLAGDIARKIAKDASISYAITEHSSAFARSLLSRTQEKQAKRVFDSADVRIAVSKSFASLLKQKFKHEFFYIPNVMQLKIDEIGKRKTNSNDNFKICNVASLDKNKRHDRLLNAFKLLHNKYPNSELHIAGDGPDAKKLKELAKDLDIQNFVKFYGAIPRSEVFELMKSSDILSVSSDYETFGLVLIEAMSFGLPVISTKCGGPESIILSEDLGILTEKDIKSFAEGLEIMISKVKHNNFDEDKIKNFVENNFSYRAVGEQIMEKLRNIIISDNYVTK